MLNLSPSKFWTTTGTFSLGVSRLVLIDDQLVMALGLTSSLA